MDSSCAKCGATKDLVLHHISYLPEITQMLCRKCDANERRQPETRGFRVLKSYPQRGILLVPKEMLETLGELVEIEGAPLSPVAILFKYGMPLKYLEEVLKIILKDIKLRKEIEARRCRTNDDTSRRTQSQNRARRTKPKKENPSPPKT